MQDLEPKREQLPTTVEKGLALVNSTNDGTMLNLKKLQGKEIGLHILQLGMAEAEANRISRLMVVVDYLEKEIFNLDKLKRLTDSEKVERYSLAIQNISSSANFIRGTVNAIDWNSIEMQLLAVTQATSGEDESKVVGSKDMTEMAKALLSELSSSIKN